MRIARSAATGVTAPSEWITGKAWVEAITVPGTAAQAKIDSVRFTPGARTVWHHHPAGQTLIVTKGDGRVQCRGGEIETIRVGDSVHIEPGEWHWHGATPTTTMTHLAIEPIPQDGIGSEAGEAVTDREYHRAGNTGSAREIPPVTCSVLLDQPLPASQRTHRVQIRRITIAPGHAGGLHVHNGPVFGSIETGSVIYQVEGEQARVLGPADVFYEPEGVRIGRFDAQDEGVTFLGYFLLDAGQERLREGRKHMTSSAPQAEHGKVPAPGLAVQAAAVHDSVELSRLVLGVAAAGGADARTLARDAGLPGWLLGRDGAMIGSAHHGRLWELAGHALQDPCLGLTAVTRHQVGDLDLYDYLFTTAGTVREALEVSGDFFHLVSTNCSLEAQPQPGGEITYCYRHALAGGLGEDLWTQFSIAGFCARISAATGRPVVPAHVAFAQPPPRSHRAFTETFGTRRIDFGASVSTFTLRASDLDRPMPGADPALTAILRRYAATLPRPQSADWLGRFRQVLAETMGEGTISVNALARRLAVSTRTLQRRLAEHGTTWRAELEAARLRRVQRASTAGPPSKTLLARQLGYADPRSVRRALRRWDGLNSSSGTERAKERVRCAIPNQRRSGKPMKSAGCCGSQDRRTPIGRPGRANPPISKGRYMREITPQSTGRWRYVIAVLISAMSVLGFGLSSAPSASASSGWTWTGTIVDAQTGRCLDSNSTGNVYTLPCNGGGYQRWTISETDTNNGTYTQVIDWYTGRCLDSNYGGSVYTLSICNGGQYQNWNNSADLLNSPVTWVFSDQQTGRCLDSNYGGSVYTLSCNRGNYQNWIER